MTVLAPAADHLDAVCDLLRRVEAEGVLRLDAAKESAYVRRYARASERGVRPGQPRFAILAADGTVVGYLSGRYSARPPGPDPAGGETAAFVSLVVVDRDSRGRGHGARAVRAFAVLARAATGAGWLGLRLDPTGDVAGRRAVFERMGFRFDAADGAARIADLTGG